MAPHWSDPYVKRVTQLLRISYGNAAYVFPEWARWMVVVPGPGGKNVFFSERSDARMWHWLMVELRFSLEEVEDANRKANALGFTLGQYIRRQVLRLPLGLPLGYEED